MADPFQEPNVQLAFSLKSGPAAPVNVRRDRAVEFYKAYLKRDTASRNNVMDLIHATGVAAVDLNEVTAVTIIAGSVSGLQELIERCF